MALPSTEAPPVPWQDINCDQWNDWKWQLANRLNSVEDFQRILSLSESEKEALNAKDLFMKDKS